MTRITKGTSGRRGDKIQAKVLDKLTLASTVPASL